MKRSLNLFLLLLLPVWLLSFPVKAATGADEQSPPHANAFLDSLDLSAFRKIPILDEGRVKPLESFARSYLIVFSGKSRVEGLSAIAWLTELLFDQETAYKRQVFDVASPDVLYAIGLQPRKKHRYSFNEISAALDAHGDTIAAIYDMNQEERTQPQRHLLNLYFKALTYAEISHSLTLIQPIFEINNAALLDTLGLEQGQKAVYLDLMPHQKMLMDMADEADLVDSENRTEAQKNILQNAYIFTVFSTHKNTKILRIVPPQWNSHGDLWFSPWDNILSGDGSPKSVAYIDLWKNLAAAYDTRDSAAWSTLTRTIKDRAFELAGPRAQKTKNDLEVLYHALNIFPIALFIYIACFVLLMAGFMSRQDLFYKPVFILLGGTALMHGTAILMRIIIMSRPPVSTLYETTIFVAFIAVVLCLLFELRRRDSTGLLVGSIIGAILLFISTRYAADGDTLKMLVAVLDTNFWLATHVVTITMGYACALVAGTLAHLYLIQRVINPADTKKHNTLLKTTLATGLIALFFSILGTILGGIWADQSWGRFWGWDPKENGAMLICLWLLWTFHGRIAGVLSPLNFMTWMALANIIVALAWFGVNLLNVGLHSYGFTDSIAGNLTLFCLGEIAFVVAMRLLIHTRTSKSGTTS